MRRFKMRKEANVKANLVSLDTLKSVLRQTMEGRLDSLFEIVTRPEEIDRQIKLSREHRIEGLKSTIEQINTYNLTLKNKIETDYSWKAVLQNAPADEIYNLVWTVLEKVDSDLLMEYIRDCKYTQDDFEEKIGQIQEDENVGTAYTHQMLVRNKLNYSLVEDATLQLCDDKKCICVEYKKQRAKTKTIKK